MSLPRIVTPDVVKYDDPLGLDDPRPEKHSPEPMMITGLSDEADASRHLAMRFNRDMMFCPNCEGLYDATKAQHDWCPYCGDLLKPIGTKARTRKFDMR